MNQLPLDAWPESLNDQVGMVRVEPEEVTERCGIQFGKSFDGLDSFRGAVCNLHDCTFALLRYDHNPDAGTIIIFEQGVFESTRGSAQLDEVLAAIGANRKELFWRKPVLNPERAPRKRKPLPA